MRLVLVTPPAIEPVTLAEAKAHLRVDSTADDTLIQGLIQAAREAAESFTGRALIHQTWRLTLDAWPAQKLPWWDGVVDGADVAGPAAAIFLPRPPLASVAEIRTYAANDLASPVPASVYDVDTSGIPGRVRLRDGQSWPEPGRTLSGIEIDFVAGYGATAAAVPQTLRLGILAEVARLYENRGDGSEGNASRLALSLWQAARVVGI